MNKENNKVFNQLKQLSIFLTFSKIKLKKEMLLKPSAELTNDEILNGLREGDQSVFRYIKVLTFPSIVLFIKQSKGTPLQAEEVFQDALIVIFKKLLKAPIKIDCKFSTYFLGICKIIWKFEHQNGNPSMLLSVDILDDKEEIEDIYKESKEFNLYRKHFKKLKKRKQEILLASFSNETYNSLYMQFGFKSAEVFKSEVARIKKALIISLSSDPDFKKCNGNKYWSYD